MKSKHSLTRIPFWHLVKVFASLAALQSQVSAKPIKLSTLEGEYYNSVAMVSFKLMKAGKCVYTYSDPESPNPFEAKRCTWRQIDASNRVAIFWEDAEYAKGKNAPPDGDIYYVMLRTEEPKKKVKCLVTQAVEFDPKPAILDIQAISENYTPICAR